MNKENSCVSYAVGQRKGVVEAYTLKLQKKAFLIAFGSETNPLTGETKESFTCIEHEVYQFIIDP